MATRTKSEVRDGSQVILNTINPGISTQQSTGLPYPGADAISYIVHTSGTICGGTAEP